MIFTVRSFMAYGATLALSAEIDKADDDNFDDSIKLDDEGEDIFCTLQNMPN